MPRPSPSPDAPWVLGLNTASETLGVALASGLDLRAELFVAPSPGARGHHAERLMVAVDALCRLAGIQPAALSALAVAVGPGGFTGVRTALAAAKTIAQALDKPLIGVSTLEALAQQASAVGLVAALVDARRGDAFGALYRKGPEGLECLIPPELASVAEWTERLAPYAAAEALVFVGDGAANHPEAVSGRWPGGAFVPTDHLLRAGAVAQLGARALAEGRYEDAVALMPEYLRAPSAVPNWQPLYAPKVEEGR
ncbi:tRNA (adenosine(37)-N6)-threonylcarbamoyltransferase complex dimerization subunit type 1 TsaB [bacterium]|nr:tRNA (adenosine(37)-N6)-threonylcarbamoyltransferase complex dimerization subunit type 1 TsaB [bacterium]